MPQTLTFEFDYIQAHVDYFFPQLALYIQYNECFHLVQIKYKAMSNGLNVYNTLSFWKFCPTTHDLFQINRIR